MSDKVEIYRVGGMLTAHGATWAFRPPGTEKSRREDFADEYRKNPVHAERDYAANPPQSVQAALHDVSAVERLANKTRPSPVRDDGGFHDWFRGDPKHEYFMHIDMSKANDPTGMGLCHYDIEADKVVMDLIHTIKPLQDWELSFERIYHLVLTIKEQLGFNLVKVSFDSWQSFYMLERLINAGIQAELYSVDRGTEAYDTLIEVLLTNRLDYYVQAQFLQEFKDLKLYKGNKYDHPPGGSKDTSDGVAGCVAACVKARTGLSLTDAEVEKSVHLDHLLKPQLIRNSETGASVYVLENQQLPPYERSRRRVVRIDAVRDVLITVIGWHDKQNNQMFVEEFLVWEEFTSDSLSALENFISQLISQVAVAAFSLNEIAPVELINFLKSTGRPVSSPLSSRTPGQKGNHVARTAVLNASAIRLAISQIKQGNLTIPHQVQLVKDLKFTTVDNMMARPYLGALAGWTDFASREVNFGRSGQELPKVTLGTPAPLHGVTNQVAANVPNAVRPGSSEVDRIRARYNTDAKQSPVAAPKQTGNKALPRPVRG